MSDVLHDSSLVSEFCKTHDVTFGYVARELGVTRKTVARWAYDKRPTRIVELALRGLTVDMHQTWQSTERAIVENYRDGMPVKDIAKKYGVSYSVVCKLACAAGIHRKIRK